jgi:O-antigen/teichoic acid export membrane protein
MKFNYTKHKIRLDRGRMWYTMFNAIITAILVYIFSSSYGIGYKILSGILAFIVIYIMGYIDEKLKLLKKEQEGYSLENPILMKILEILKKIENENIGKNK